jgi:hypothetical protein
MREDQSLIPRDGRFGRSAGSMHASPGAFRAAAAILLAACVAIPMLAWPGSTRSARPADLSVSIDPTAGLAGSSFSIAAMGFSAFVLQIQATAFIQFDMSGQVVTIGQQAVSYCPDSPQDNQVYGFGRGCGPDVLVAVPPDAPPGPHTVTVHVPNAAQHNGTIDLQTTFTVIAPDTATPTNTDTSTTTGTDTPTATGTPTATASGTPTATASGTNTPTVTGTPTDTTTGTPAATNTVLATASATNTVLATATGTRSITSTPAKAAATATATPTPSSPVAVLVQPLFSTGKLALTVRGQPQAAVSISLAIQHSQNGTTRTVYRLNKTGTLDTKGGYSAVLSINYRGRGLAALTVIVQGRSKSVRLSRMYRYSG